MPAAFDKCVKNGGRVRTRRGPNKQFGLKSEEYVHICFTENEMYIGHIKKKKKK